MSLILENFSHQMYKGKVKGYEIDFVCKKPNKKIYVQVSYILGSDSTIEREFKHYWWLKIIIQNM